MAAMDEVKSGFGRLWEALPKNADDVNRRREELEYKLEEFPILRNAEESTGVPKLYLFLGAVSVNILLLITGIFYKLLGTLMTRFTGFMYPAYASFKAIESVEKEDDTLWLTYWFVFACFTMLEETLLKPLESILPVYFVFKSLFCLWCCLPQTRGAELIYRLTVDLIKGEKYE